MLRISLRIAVLAIVSFGLSASSAAADPVTDAVLAIKGCQGVLEESERLKCFDGAVADLFSPTLQSAESGCKITQWNYQQKLDYIYLNGETSCRSGKLMFRLFDGSTDRFIASDFTYIEGYTFQTYVDGRAPTQLNIKYSID